VISIEKSQMSGLGLVIFTQSTKASAQNSAILYIKIARHLRVNCPHQSSKCEEGEKEKPRNTDRIPL
jgi:hypothetical protein